MIISEHEGLYWAADETGRRRIERQDAIHLLYTAQAECDASVLDAMLLAAELAGRRNLRDGTLERGYLEGG